MWFNVGYALYFENGCSNSDDKGIFIEDIYLMKSLRKPWMAYDWKVFKYICKVAREKKFSCVEWSDFDWRRPSLESYTKITPEQEKE